MEAIQFGVLRQSDEWISRWTEVQAVKPGTIIVKLPFCKYGTREFYENFLPVINDIRLHGVQL